MNEKTKEILEKQLELLSEQSKTCGSQELPLLTKAMIDLYYTLVYKDAYSVKDNNAPTLKVKIADCDTNDIICKYDEFIKTKFNNTTI